MRRKLNNLNVKYQCCPKSKKKKKKKKKKSTRSNKKYGYVTILVMHADQIPDIHAMG